MAKNLVQLSRLTSLQREEAQLQGERGQLVAQVAEAKGKIAEIQLQIIQVDEDLSSDVAKEVRDIDSKIGEFVERKVTAEDQLKRTDIRAPQDGIVFQSTANTVGGVITAGDPIMLIVPESDNLKVEVKVDPKDIDQVQFGQPVVLRFTSFNVRTTPELNGTISRIAADTTTDQRTGQSYYLVRISMTADEIKRLGDVKLTPGMPVMPSSRPANAPCCPISSSLCAISSCAPSGKNSSLAPIVRRGSARFVRRLRRPPPAAARERIK